MTEQTDIATGGKPFEHDPFKSVVAAHSGWVYGMARRQLGDANLAEDATQAVFIAMWRRRKHLGDGKRPVGGWLVRATHYACNDIRKFERRLKNRERKAAAMRSEEMRASAGPAVESNAEQLTVLDAAMQKLSTGDRDVLVARFFQSCSARQVAQQLRVSEAAAEKRITRAVGKLRKIMAWHDMPLDNVAVAALLASGVGTASSERIGRVLQGVSGKIPVGLGIAHAARKVAFHAAHIPAIMGAAAVTLAIATAAIALKASHATVNPTPTKTVPAADALTDNSTGSQTGVLICVAYEMMVRGNFVWAVQTDGKFLSGKPGGVLAYDISAHRVRALARSQADRGRVLLGRNLIWRSAALQPNHSVVSHSLLFFHEFKISGAKFAFPQETSDLSFHCNARAYANFMRVGVRFDADSKLMVVNHKIVHTPYIYTAAVKIAPDHAVVLLRSAANSKGRHWYSAVVFDVERYPAELVSAITRIIRLRRYIRSGSAGLEKIAADSVAWNQFAKAHPVAPLGPNSRWSKTLPGGAVVTLCGVTSGTWEFCPWTPDGNAMPGWTRGCRPHGLKLKPGDIYSFRNVQYGILGFPFRHAYYLSDGNMAVLLDIQLPENLSDFPNTGREHPLETRGGEWVKLPHPHTGTLHVGLDSGTWKILGTAAVYGTFRRSFLYKGCKFTLAWVSPLINAHNKIVGSQLGWSCSKDPYPNQVIAVGVVDREGRLVAPETGLQVLPNQFPFLRFQISRAAANGEYGLEHVLVSPSDVKRYVWITRPQHWVTFHGFALKPLRSPETVFRMARRLRAARTMRIGSTGCARQAP
ncbi:MAG: RNA polymerase sigma factor [Planctomycetes bacterium]|nr:RNA polymerase sigma factor [Planctomycetota bacterium]